VKGFPKSHRKFREMVVEQFCNFYLSSKALETSAPQQSTQSKSAWNTDISRTIGRHFPAIVKKPEGNRREGVKKRKGKSTNTRNFWRGNCIMCHKLISSKCTQCDVYLCIIDDGDHDTCWFQFHTCEDLFTKFSNEVESSSDLEESDCWAPAAPKWIKKIACYRVFIGE